MWVPAQLTACHRDVNKHPLTTLIINLIYIVQFDTNSILTALYIVITHIQMQYVHI